MLFDGGMIEYAIGWQHLRVEGILMMQFEAGASLQFSLLQGKISVMTLGVPE